MERGQVKDWERGPEEKLGKKNQSTGSTAVLKHASKKERPKVVSLSNNGIEERRGKQEARR